MDCQCAGFLLLCFLHDQGVEEGVDVIRQVLDICTDTFSGVENGAVVHQFYTGFQDGVTVNSPSFSTPISPFFGAGFRDLFV